jgi:hypothetical protein
LVSKLVARRRRGVKIRSPSSVASVLPLAASTIRPSRIQPVLEYLGAEILRRRRWAWVAGLVVGSLVVATHIFYHRLLDGWALGGLLTNILILLILALKQEEFQ